MDNEIFYFRMPQIVYTVRIVLPEGSTRFKDDNNTFRFKVAAALWHPGVPRSEKNLRNAGNLNFETRDSIRARSTLYLM